MLIGILIKSNLPKAILRQIWSSSIVCGCNKTWERWISFFSNWFQKLSFSVRQIIKPWLKVLFSVGRGKYFALGCCKFHPGSPKVSWSGIKFPRSSWNVKIISRFWHFQRNFPLNKQIVDAIRETSEGRFTWNRFPHEMFGQMSELESPFSIEIFFGPCFSWQKYC